MDRRVGVGPQQLGNLLADALRVRGRKVDLVDHGDDLEVRLDGKEEVRERLRLNALGRVDDEEGAFARG